MKQEYVKLHANCIPVKGYKQSFIFDLQRSKSSNSIPNSLFDILLKYPDESIIEIKKAYNNEYDEIIDDYFQFLLKNEFAFKCLKQEVDCFPKLDLTWKSSSVIENAIIDISLFNENDLKKIITELSELRCNALQIRFEKEYSIHILEIIGSLLKNTRILTVEFVIKFSDQTIFETLISISDKYPRFQRIFIYNSPDNRMSSCSRIIFDKKNMIPSNDCGIISSRYFSINIDIFTESDCHNTCLNRKISIDSQGNIKNCPSMQHQYGNIKNINLLNVVKNPEYRKWWYYKKDDIDVCMDCEFRHICTDCRAFIREPGNIYSQPSKCGYNPYIALWEEQDDWVSVEQWRKENLEWEKQAKENRASYSKEHCEENLKEELEYFNNL